MSEGSLRPDAPFRSGTTGKYKLLIRNVTSKASGYEYELVDAAGKEYNTRSGLHYAEGGILRCMVTFEVTSARLVVSSTVLCKKQDLATLIPEVKKKEPAPNPKAPKVTTTPSTKPPREHLGDPRFRRASGLYVLRVVRADKTQIPFIYHVEDARGNIYQAQSDKDFSVGKKVACKVKVTLTPGGILKVSVVSMGSAVPKTNKVSKNPLKHYHSDPSYSQGGMPTPANGDHFRLIYTPMGNKR